MINNSIWKNYCRSRNGQITNSMYFNPVSKMVSRYEYAFCMWQGLKDVTRESFMSWPQGQVSHLCPRSRIGSSKISCVLFFNSLTRAQIWRGFSDFHLPGKLEVPWASSLLIPPANKKSHYSCIFSIRKYWINLFHRPLSVNNNCSNF